MLKQKRTILKYIIVIVIMLLFVFYIHKFINDSYYGDKIRRSFDGIKYQSGYSGSYSTVKIELDGFYKKQNEGIGYIFEGDFIINGEPCKEKRILFNEHNMTILKTDSIYGMVYVSDGLEEMTIEIYELDDRGRYGFSYDGGWIISAPCQNREEAVIITNKVKYQDGHYAW